MRNETDTSRINLVNFYPEKRLEQYPTVLTLGVARLGSYLSAQEHDVRIISTPLENALSLDEIMRNDPESIGFTINFWDRMIALSLIAELRQKKYAGNILVGGPEASILQHENHPALGDVLYFPADGEIPMIEYLKHKEQDTASLQRIINETSFQNQPNNIIPTGFPLFSEEFYKLLTSENQKNAPYTWYDSVRGCPYSCGYCDHGRNRKMISHYPDGIVHQEIKNIGEQFSDTFIIDPIIGGGDRAEAKKRLMQFKQLAPNTSLELYMRPETIDSEIIDIVSGMNITRIYVGIQTLNKDVPKWLRQNNSKSLNNLQALCSVTPVTLELIIGLPGDTFAGLKQSLQYVAETIRPKQIAAYPLSVLDGTELATILTDQNNGNTIEDKNNLWVARDQTTHRAISSSSYTNQELERMKEYAFAFIADYNSTQSSANT